MHIEAILRNSLIYWFRQGAQNSNGTRPPQAKAVCDRIWARQFSHTCEKLFGKARGDKCGVMNKFASSHRNLERLGRTLSQGGQVNLHLYA